MTNTYKSKKLRSIKLSIDGSSKRVTFTPITDGGSEYTTSDEACIKALERHGDFKKSFFLKSSVSDGKKSNRLKKEGDTPPADKQMVEVAEITSCVDARDFLNEKGSEVALNSKDKIIAEAQRMGFVFPNLN